ncbi:MAG: FAD-dependent tricarballylate dehydrogenase TcuA [Chloroflexi bacterium]|nr:FAD-dependent tricarballylate dehydrogenase TcuA [Chloroflexota bacterium]
MPQKSRDGYHLIVVGAGNAALTTALTAREQGAQVVVLEKAPKELRGGNSRFTGGLFRFAYRSIEEITPLRPDVLAAEWENIDVGTYPPERFYQDMMRVTGGLTDPDLSMVLAERSYETVRWLTGLGVRWEWTVLWSVRQGDQLRFNPGAVLEVENKGIGLTNTLFRVAEESGIEVQYQSKVVRLLQDRRGRVCGVTVKTPDGFHDLRARAVVLASGGFQANPEMRVRYLGPDWNLVKVRGTRFNTGEVLQAALDIGAQPVGHWAGCHATPVDANSPPVGDLALTDRTNRLSYPFALMVNVEGKRFVDEGEDLGQYTYAKTGRSILAQPRSLAFQIFDQKTVHLREKRYETGKPVVADTLDELARRLGLDPAALNRTVQEFNAAVRDGEFDPSRKDGKSTAGLEPPRSNWAQRIDSPPFVAYPVTGGITFTFGGIKIDTQARVLDTEDNPIPGLYATGEVTGGFFYFNYPGGAGLMRGAVFGRIAGRNAVGE